MSTPTAASKRGARIMIASYAAAYRSVNERVSDIDISQDRIAELEPAGIPANAEGKYETQCHMGLPGPGFCSS
ncbi:MAG: hypothetical protein OER98_03755 [Gammaproteobacteria bacterium]|nr:hypothetical protein [Gammaproteobacteria bacterium]